MTHELGPEFGRPAPLRDGYEKRITHDVRVAIAEMNFTVEEQGLESYFRHAYHSLPQDFRLSIRGLVRTYYPMYDPESYPLPEPRAIEHGLVIGTQLARAALDADAFANFCEQADWSNIEKIKSQESRAKDLADMVQEGGAVFLRVFGPAFSGRVMSYNPHRGAEARHENNLYQYALGYQCALALSCIVADYAHDSQPIEVLARFRMSFDAAVLNSPLITEDDLSRFFSE